MTRCISAYKLEGLDALDLQLVLEMDDNHPDYGMEDEADDLSFAVSSAMDS
jgi:hypothetical protein